jgi:hypothetical protein
MPKNLENTKWNPWAPIAELESREHFCCPVLRRNTFLSNSLAMPTGEEKRTAEKVCELLPSKVVINPTPMDLSLFSTFLRDSSLVTAPTVSTVSKKLPTASKKSKKERNKQSLSTRKKATPSK